MPRKHESKWREVDPQDCNFILDVGSQKQTEHHEIKRWAKFTGDDARAPTVLETNLGLFVSSPNGHFGRHSRFHKTRKGAMTAASLVSQWTE
jgi:hypothetical protein